jgi:hypothetical protein
MKEHLPGPLESLAPSDGIYSEGEGGVSTCNCDGQNFNLQRTHAGVEKGWATFTIVIGPDGQISNPSQCQSRGTLTDVLCRNLLDAPKTYGWTCKPAMNVDGQHVPVRKIVHVNYTCGDVPLQRDFCWVYVQNHPM